MVIMVLLRWVHRLAETSRCVPPHLGSNLGATVDTKMRRFAGEGRRAKGEERRVTRVMLAAGANAWRGWLAKNRQLSKNCKPSSPPHHFSSFLCVGHQLVASVMFIPPHLVGQQSVNQNCRPASSRQAPNDSLSFLPKDTHSSSSLSSTFVISDAVAATDAYAFDEVLSTSDIVVGAMLAFTLAFGWSFLNGQSTSSNFISWRSQLDGSNTSRDTAEASTSGIVDNDITQRSDREEINGYDVDDDSAESDISAPKVFNADNWKEMSREENYVLYNTRVRALRDGGRERKAIRDAVTTKGDTEGDVEIVSGARSEKKWVFVALLVLFVPIFSVEFFFALSRQFMCGGDAMNQPEWAQILCSPYKGP